MTLYKAYADELSALIESGELKPGQRMPSVREASRHRGISTMTVLIFPRSIACENSRSPRFPSR